MRWMWTKNVSFHVKWGQMPKCKVKDSLSRVSTPLPWLKWEERSLITFSQNIETVYSDSNFICITTRADDDEAIVIRMKEHLPPLLTSARLASLIGFSTKDNEKWTWGLPQHVNKGKQETCFEALSSQYHRILVMLRESRVKSFRTSALRATLYIRIHQKLVESQKV